MAANAPPRSLVELYAGMSQIERREAIKLAYCSSFAGRGLPFRILPVNFGGGGVGKQT